MAEQCELAAAFADLLRLDMTHLLKRLPFRRDAADRVRVRLGVVLPTRERSVSDGLGVSSSPQVERG
jgi:hypothetical protein